VSAADAGGGDGGAARSDVDVVVELEPDDESLLEISDLDAFYGPAHVLQGVSFTMRHEPVAIIGRNGMGKTTLCNAIMQIRPATTRGSIRFRGEECVGRASYKIAASGIGYVPQGRRLFESLSVDEHLRMVAPRGGDRRWTPDAVYELFPRLAQRRKNGGMQLSGGEQQMLAIGRALLTNPRLLLMDEPSEGLAPAIIESLTETFRRLSGEGLAILVVEQNLAVATALAERQLVMVGGRISTETTAGEITNDPEAQRRYLGVERA
jgi:branched-chain amino acid transport system ATP-binding protein